MTCLWAASRAVAGVAPAGGGGAGTAVGTLAASYCSTSASAIDWLSASSPIDKFRKNLVVSGPGAPAGPAAPEEPRAPRGCRNSSPPEIPPSPVVGAGARVAPGAAVAAGTARLLTIAVALTCPGPPVKKSHAPDKAKSTTVTVTKADARPSCLGVNSLRQAGVRSPRPEGASNRPSILSHRSAGARSLAVSAS